MAFKINIEGLAKEFGFDPNVPGLKDAELKRRAAVLSNLKPLADKLVNDCHWTMAEEIAYFLGTTWHETAFTFAPITEYGNLKYFEKYSYVTALGKRLGNNTMGDGFKFRGRGYVMITGRGNYTKFSEELCVDLLTSPQLANTVDIAYKIASIGFRRGMFTGKRMADYIRPGKVDYIGARRIINGTDRASTIADYAKRALKYISKED